MKILVFGAALRKDSFNKKLAAVAADALRAQSDVTVEHVDFADFRMPVYDGDLEEGEGVPAGAQELGRLVAAADALVISTPEYNGSIAGALKNAIDWVSRIDPMPWDGKPLLLLGASPGALGAVRGLWHTRQPFDVVGCYVYPEMFGLPKAHQAFGADGKLTDGKTQERLIALVKEYLAFARRR